MNAVLAEYSDERTLFEHERFVDAARVHARIAAPSSIDPLHDLLRAIAEVLDVRDVFPRISEIAMRLLAHDSLDLVVHDDEGQVTLRARSTDDVSNEHQVDVSSREPFVIVGDLCESDGADGAIEDRAPFIAEGYRSCVSVRVRVGAEWMQLTFWSKHAEAYREEDVAQARHIAALLTVAVAHQRLAEEARVDAVRVRTESREPRGRVLGMAERGRTGAPLGESSAWRTVLKRAMQVAATETTVFLQGESGTGKEVLARFIHRNSPRRNGPFVAINCAALPEQLLESELFGYERGAFTGAQQSKAGQIELAATGVLFLDEVSEMNPAAQAKLLRFLQEREFQRLGGTRVVKANVRVIAASNRDLRQAVQQGTFREDLYYRLQVFDIPLPPLRERSGDIALLAESFASELGRTFGRRVRVAPAAMSRLTAHRWPGNVRELQNALERAAILSESGVIEPEHLALQPVIARPVAGTDLGAVEREKIEQVMRETDGNKAKAARRLGITRTQLYVRLRRHGLESGPPLALA
jgi:transcriptional regulator with GAF, ATPase, and Fis domain